MSAQFVAVAVASRSQIVVATPSQAVLSVAAVIVSQVVVATPSQVVLSVAAVIVSQVVVATLSQVVVALPKVVEASEEVGLDELDNEIGRDESKFGPSAAIIFFKLLREVLVEGAVRRPLATEDRAVWSPVVSAIMAAIAIFGSS